MDALKKALTMGASMDANDEASRQFANHNAWDEKANETLVQSGVLVVRSLLLLNGAAVIAMLAFLSSTITADLPDSYARLVSGMVAILPMFGFGAFFAVIAAVFAYFVNYAYLWAHRQNTFHRETPYIRPVPWLNKGLTICGHVGTILAILTGFLAGAFFLYGLISITELASHAAWSSVR